MFQEAAQFLLDVILQPFAILLLLRFHMQWLHAPMRNAIGEFIMSITNFVVLPTRRYIPAFRGYDTSTLLLAYIVETIYLYLSEFIWVYRVPGDIGLFIVGILLSGIVKLMSLSITLLMVALVIQAILSWIKPYSPAMSLLNSLTQPFLRPLQKRIPPAGHIDLAPFVLLVICQLVQMIPLYLLDHAVRSLL